MLGAPEKVAYNFKTLEGYNENLLQVNSKLFWYNIYS